MKVIIVDDIKPMHRIMKRMLEKVQEVEIVGSFRETSSAFSYLMEHEVDLVFVDIQMPGESGLEFARRIRKSGKQVKLVFVTSHKEFALSAFEVDAYSYLVKPIVQEKLHHTVQRALIDMRPISHKEPMINNPLVKEPVLPKDPIVHAVLTEQEARVLQLVDEGLSNKEIAERLAIKGETVKSHIKNIFRKFGATNRIQALRIARQEESTK